MIPDDHPRHAVEQQIAVLLPNPAGSIMARTVRHQRPKEGMQTTRSRGSVNRRRFKPRYIQQPEPIMLFPFIPRTGVNPCHRIKLGAHDLKFPQIPLRVPTKPRPILPNLPTTRRIKLDRKRRGHMLPMQSLRIRLVEPPIRNPRRQDLFLLPCIANPCITQDPQKRLAPVPQLLSRKQFISEENLCLIPHVHNILAIHEARDTVELIPLISGVTVSQLGNGVNRITEGYAFAQFLASVAVGEHFVDFGVGAQRVASEGCNLVQVRGFWVGTTGYGVRELDEDVQNREPEGWDVVWSALEVDFSGKDNFLVYY
jgi:hypothetical protein